MSILVGPDTRLVVQGITGREGEFHSRAMQAYGTTIVAGVTPGKGGQTALDGTVPVFDTMVEAVRETGANASCVFVPAAGAPDAVMEAAAAGIATIFCITEGIPALDMISALETVRQAGARLIGPNCPGATSPGSTKVGIIPGSIHRTGRVGVVSRSGTLTYEAVQAMTDAGLGQSTCVGIGGDPIIGTSFLEVLQLFAADEGTGGDRPDRRDRRGRRRDGCRLGRRASPRRPQSRVHRRPHRTRGQAHGPCRRHHLGRCGHRGVQGRGPRSSRLPRCRLAARAPDPPARRRLPRLGERRTVTHLMDLVAGDAPAILLAISTDDLEAFDDRARFPAHVALGGGLDPTWLDLFAEAARSVVGTDGPGEFLDARIELGGPHDDENRSIERVDPAWIGAIARIPESRVSAIASAWIDLIEEELGGLARDEKPWIRDLAGRLVAFCRVADRAPDVLFAWSLR